ncbi:uncharacterized protein [Oryza sativa Japonica Group]|uniref:Expressed protein n=4 Tax=Oryza TaxID=4527 RepID=Q75HK7_ORYSJ|nr:uncharacterized protein LOC4333425 [Oryza sativa Japonica Group]XP_052150477.1 uncharacterized protein LOC127768863 [Oryza glaberrima]KAB8092604.1 hypothetical protein EE612_018862 [Oryza sativa]AAR89873.1 expressed protein [Oryza sativa Japonica Group]ABF97549.1 expressed protein [Oryza sativa Japonica Group]KAF2940195.1 hypothetical protein DAI22_03g253100 [Oryza sativa Japonica Group]BAF12557.1 Os03g0608000 [Oryza sativa Japonica Group]|eukprot:NP_001050643.1 Os03g0608000 [Oryza sativa Japonica Group]
MAAASQLLATATCLLALLLAAGWMVAAADARRLLDDVEYTGTAMPPAPAMAPVAEPGMDVHGGRMMLAEGRGLLAGGLRLAGRLLLGLGL